MVALVIEYELTASRNELPVIADVGYRESAVAGKVCIAALILYHKEAVTGYCEIESLIGHEE